MTENVPTLTFQELDSILRIIDSAPRDGEVKITIGDVTLEVSTRSGTAVSEVAPPAAAAAPPAPAAAEPASAQPAVSAHPQAPASSIDESEVTGLTVVAAPMTGVFYAKPSPTAEAFVQVGDTVTKGQDLAIIEVMKLMNRIGSPVDGVVRRTVVENEALVEHGSPLFYIEATDGES
ncbi:biotin/lipoyl-containing protein [Specibacter sp. NPDC078709]|uniref:acetyl-CoA carboxylase biotin carboxyl carrier protein n=1 Tax=Specibacter sp. NPDC078709 TaxID=3154364 RepID=UPI003441D372